MSAPSSLMLSSSPVVVVLNPVALPTARRVLAALPSAVLHVLGSRVPACTDAAEVFENTLPHLQALFQAGQPIIALCASGIVIRALAPLLTDKQSEPPVLAVAVDGSVVVPLLGGHHGANALARQVADALHGVAAITTAGDSVLGVALDQPPAGWTLANPQDTAPLMARLLAGEPVRIDCADGLDPALADWLRAGSLTEQDDAALCLRITDRQDSGSADTLVYHPPVLALGVGCERNAPLSDLSALVSQTLEAAGLAPAAVAAVVSVSVKSNEAAVHALAEQMGVPARFYSPERLEEETPRLLTPSEVVFTEVGCHGVAEGAALAAVGSAGTLVVPKAKSRRSTCAIARSVSGIDGAACGRPRGRLTIVGIGPGSDGWRTPAVSAAVAGCSDLVGYGLYLDLLGPLTTGKARHQTDLGKEEERARKALDLAAEGRTVALVCSGDAGIFALATLVFELLDHEDRADWRMVEVSVEPGVSAIQAAAARAGAPIGHDFCLLSLSDLLTPRDVVLKRIAAAGEGDFVIGFYNPVSLRRRDLLAEARDILLQHRPASTPVILARNLGRDGESITIVDLAELTPDMADMLTLVLVGNSESRRLSHDRRDWVYTPRGYGDKWKRG
ncbi:precorrin-3B C(17)-methyltransferase [Insolitispirillum peregrinum]|uniref:precorrin-3B C(17)-methyltransferase n=1 Tax=Insolitispirillum peregrinum TaxID=80876 RepID=UPI0036164652